MSTIPSVTLTPALSGTFRTGPSLLQRVLSALHLVSARSARAIRASQHRQVIAHDAEELLALANKYQSCSPSLASDLRAAAVRALQD